MREIVSSWKRLKVPQLPHRCRFSALLLRRSEPLFCPTWIFFSFHFVPLSHLQMTRRSSAISARDSSPPTATSPSIRRSTARSSTLARSATKCSTAKTWCRSTTGGTAWVSRCSRRAGSGKPGRAAANGFSFIFQLDSDSKPVSSRCWDVFLWLLRPKITHFVASFSKLCSQSCAFFVRFTIAITWRKKWNCCI